MYHEMLNVLASQIDSFVPQDFGEVEDVMRQVFVPPPPRHQDVTTSWGSCERPQDVTPVAWHLVSPLFSWVCHTRVACGYVIWIIHVCDITQRCHVTLSHTGKRLGARHNVTVTWHGKKTWLSLTLACIKALSKTVPNPHGSTHIPTPRLISPSTCRGHWQIFSTDPPGRFFFKNHPAKFFLRDPWGNPLLWGTQRDSRRNNCASALLVDERIVKEWCLRLFFLCFDSFFFFFLSWKSA